MTNLFKLIELSSFQPPLSRHVTLEHPCESCCRMFIPRLFLTLSRAISTSPVPALRGARWSPRLSAHTSASPPADAWRCPHSCQFCSGFNNFCTVPGAAIVSRHGQPPVAKLLVQLPQIARRGTGGRIHLLPLVKRPQAQPQIFRRRRHQLKHAQRARPDSGRARSKPDSTSASQTSASGTRCPAKIGFNSGTYFAASWPAMVSGETFLIQISCSADERRIRQGGGWFVPGGGMARRAVFNSSATSKVIQPRPAATRRKAGFPRAPQAAAAWCWPHPSIAPHPAHNRP